MQTTYCVSDPGIPFFSFLALCLIARPPSTKQYLIIFENCQRKLCVGGGGGGG